MFAALERLPSFPTAFARQKALFFRKIVFFEMAHFLELTYTSKKTLNIQYQEEKKEMEKYSLLQKLFNFKVVKWVMKHPVYQDLKNLITLWELK